MATEQQFEFDVFISYSSKDEQWVIETLLPRLEQGGVKACIDYRDFKPGWTSLHNIQHAVRHSRHTLLVLTENWFSREWTQFESFLSSTNDPTGLRQRTIPLLLRKSEPPDTADFITALSYVDFTRADRAEFAWRMLFTALGKPPEPVNLPVKPTPAPAASRPHVLVMKGGGLKGIAYVGALEVLDQYGYRFDHFVGTSAGAISAALLAAGYSSQELQYVLAGTDFRQFKDGWLPLSLMSLWFTKGLYRGDVFTAWLEEKLRKKFPAKFGSVPILFKHLNEMPGKPNRLTIFASTKSKTAYRFDSTDAKDQETKISFACRCSMAIPYFFKPEHINGELVFDGGMQNNYPVRALLEKDTALKETLAFIGLYLGPKTVQRRNEWALSALFSIATEAGDEEAKNEFIDNTIVIDPEPVATTDFSLSESDVQFLLAEGRASALQWLAFHGNDQRPTLAEVEQAKKEAEALRVLTAQERKAQRQKARRSLKLKLLLGLILATGACWFVLWR